MIRGTTAQFKFKLPYKVEQLSVVKITFWQEDYSGPHSSRPLPIVKVLSQCSQIGVNELLVSLNKEETLRFTDERRAYVQLRAKTVDGSVFSSKKEMIKVYPVYDDSVLEDEILPSPSPEDDGFVILDGSVIL